jgi:hypothetical protein
VEYASKKTHLVPAIPYLLTADGSIKYKKIRYRTPFKGKPTFTFKNAAANIMYT